MSVRAQVGHSEGSEHTFVLHREHRYPVREGTEWHAQRVGYMDTVREGKPIISNEEEPVDVAVWELACVMGGVVLAMNSSRKCCSCSTTE